MTADADDPNAAHYFADEPSTDSAPVDIDVVLPDTAFTMRTDRGVFSRGGLDTGTSVLLRADQPLAPQGDLLEILKRSIGIPLLSADFSRLEVVTCFLE